MENLRQAIGSLKETVNKECSEPAQIENICNELCRLIHSNLILTEKSGLLLVSHIVHHEAIGLIAKETKKESKRGQYIEAVLNDQLLSIITTKENLDLKLYNTNDFSLLVPIFTGNERQATLIMFRENKFFTDDEIALIEFCGMIVSILLKQITNNENADALRQVTIVKSAIGTLTYSELEAMICIFSEFEGTEGTIIARKVAEKTAVAHSVIVNALRKLESAGILSARSLGMKGTHIKVIYKNMITEIKKLKSL